MTKGAHVDGLSEFVKELRALDRMWPKELRDVHKDIAKLGSEGSRGIAVGMGGVQAKSAGAIGPSSDQNSARIRVNPSSRYPAANVAFWGAKKRTGWFGARKYDGSTSRQHAPWIGNSWDVATFNGGPYAINRALYFDLDRILDTYLAMLDDLSRRAFPD